MSSSTGALFPSAPRGRTQLQSRPWALLAVALVMLFTGSACGSGARDDGETGASDIQAEATAVSIKDFAFDPAQVEVSAGERVTWTNDDDAPHSILDASAADRKSETLARGATFAVTYETAGTFPYVCGIHQYMAGQVTVTEN